MKDSFNQIPDVWLGITFRQGSDANIQVTQFYKTHEVFYCIVKQKMQVL